jgi:hypothetical protein
MKLVSARNLKLDDIVRTPGQPDMQVIDIAKMVGDTLKITFRYITEPVQFKGPTEQFVVLNDLKEEDEDEVF